MSLILKRISLLTLAAFATAGCLFCLFAAPLLIHNPGWQMVERGVLIVAICYAVMAIILLNKAMRVRA